MTYKDKISGEALPIHTMNTKHGPRLVVASNHIRIIERDLRHSRPQIISCDDYVDYSDYLIRRALAEQEHDEPANKLVEPEEDHPFMLECLEHEEEQKMMSVAEAKQAMLAARSRVEELDDKSTAETERYIKFLETATEDGDFHSEFFDPDLDQLRDDAWEEYIQACKNLSKALKNEMKIKLDAYRKRV